MVRFNFKLAGADKKFVTVDIDDKTAAKYKNAGIKELEKKVADYVFNLTSSGKEIGDVIHKVDSQHKLLNTKVKNSTGVSAKLVSIAGRKLTSKSRTFDQIFTDLSENNKNLSKVDILKYLLLFPLAGLTYIFHPGKTYDYQTTSLINDPYNEEVLTSTLSEARDILTSQDKEAVVIDRGLNFIGQWKSSTLEGKQVAVKNLAEDLMNNKPSQMLIPTGYWRGDDHYEPILLTIDVSADGRVTMTERGYGQERLGEVTAYQAESVTPENLSSMVHTLVVFSERPQKLENPRGFIERHLLGYVKDAFMPKGGDELKKIESESWGKVRQKMIELSGLKKISSSEIDVRSSDGDPMKVVVNSINSLAGSQVEKLAFTTALFRRHADRLLEEVKGMDPSEGYEIVQRIEREGQGLARRAGKVGGQTDRDIETLLKEIADLKLKLAEKINGKETQLARFDKVKNVSFALKVPGISGQSRTKSTKQVAGLTRADIEKIKAVRAGFAKPTKESLPATLEVFRELSNRCDQLVDEGNYGAALKMHHLVMKDFPATDKTFWSLYKEGRTDESKMAFVEDITRFNQAAWESRLKTTLEPLDLKGVNDFLAGVVASQEALGLKADRPTNLYWRLSNQLTNCPWFIAAKNDRESAKFKALDKALRSGLTQLDIKFRYEKLKANSSPDFRNITFLETLLNPSSNLSTRDSKSVREILNGKERLQFATKKEGDDAVRSILIDKRGVSPKKGKVIFSARTPIDTENERGFRHPNLTMMDQGIVVVDTKAHWSQKETLEGNRVAQLVANAASDDERRAPVDETVGIQATGEGSLGKHNNYSYYPVAKPSNYSDSKAENVFLRVLRSPSDLKKVEARQKFIKALTRNAPVVGFNSELRPLVEKLQNELWENKDYESYYALMQLTSLVDNQMLVRSPDRDGKKGLPNLANQAEIDKIVTLSREGKLNLLVPPYNEIAVSILTAISDARDGPERDDLIKNNAAFLLQLGSILAVTGEITPVPVLSRSALDWAKNELVFALIDGETITSEAQNKVLNDWVAFRGKSSLPGNWKEGPEGIFVKNAGEKETVVDLNSLQIVKVDGKALEGIATDLPSQMVTHPIFQKVFGETKLTDIVVQPTESSGEFLYTFKDRFNKEYKVYLNSDTGDVLIEKHFPTGGWHRLTYPEGEPQSGVEQLIAERELWINIDNSQKALLFTGENIASVTKGDIYGVTLSKKGAITKIKSQSGQEMINDIDEDLYKVIGPLDKSRVIFLKNPKSKVITEIRFVGQGFSLVRGSDQTPWVLQGDNSRYDGAELVLGGQRDKAVQRFLAPLGVNVEQIGLTVKKGGRTHFLMFPNEITTKESHRVSGLTMLDIKKQESSTPPLSLSIDDDGLPEGSSGAYLYMSYLMAEKHEYAQASYFLEKAVSTKVANDREIEQIVKIENLFQTFPETSVRSAALKIKGLLGVQRILREQAQEKSLEGKEWEDKLLGAEKIVATFNRYQKLVGKTQESRVGLLTEIALNAEEIEELQRVERVSLSEFVETTREDIGSLRPLDKQTINQELPLYLMRMAKPLKDPKELLSKLTPLTEEVLVEHFFELAELIRRKEVTDGQLAELLAPTDNPLLLSTRLALLTFAQTEKNENFSAKKVWADRTRVIPQSILDLGGVWNELNQQEADNILEKWIKSIENLPQRVGDQLYDGITIWPNALKISDATVPVIINEERKVNIVEFKKKIEEDPTYFGPEVTSMIIEALDQVAPMIPKNELIKLVETNCQINLVEAAIKAQDHARIQELTKHGARHITTGVEGVYQLSDFKPEGVETKFSSAYEKVDVAGLTALKDNLEKANNELTQLPTSSAGEDADLVGFKSKDRAGLVEGIKESFDSLVSAQEVKKSLNVEQLTDFRNNLEGMVKAHHLQAKQAHDDLIELLKDSSETNKLPLSVRRALQLSRSRGDVGHDAVMVELKKAYQLGEIGSESIEKALTLTLYHSSRQKILERGCLSKLESLERMESDSNDWINLSTDILQVFDMAVDINRYYDVQNQKLVDPSLTRKVLILEDHEGFAVRDEQKELIKKMTDTSDGFRDWFEMKVGMGKTSVVMPIVIMMLIEQGECPTAVVKEALLKQNLDSLDLATRKLLQEAGVEFSFNIKSDTSVRRLQGELLRLLEVKKNRGYPITTAQSLLSLDQKRQLLQSEERDLIGEFTSAELTELREKPFAEIKSDELKTKYLKLVDVQKRITLLSQIRSQFNILMIDEVDDIQNVLCENNVTDTSEIVTLNKIMRDLLKDLIILGVTTDDKDVKELFNAIRSQSQLKFTQKDLLQKYLRALLIDGLKKNGSDWNIPQEVLELTETAEGQEHLVNYFINKEGGTHVHNLLESLKNIDDGLRSISALKKQFQNGLVLALQQNPEIDAGVKRDGFQIGPRVSGTESASQFSEESDILANHYLSYFVQLPNSEFINETIESQRYRNPDRYNEWEVKAAAAGTTLFDYLNSEDQYSERFFILDEIMDQLNPKKSQIAFNVQDVSYGRQVGGMTGTLREDCLYDTKEGVVKTGQPRKAVGRVLLESAAVKGMPTVISADKTGGFKSDLFKQMVAAAKEPDCHAVINQGYDFHGAPSGVVVRELRRSGVDRTFVFIDAETRQFMLWERGKNVPVEVSKEHLNKLMATDADYRMNVVCYFAPPDTRGTDVRLPPGGAALFVSEKCSEEDLVQSIGRMRQNGRTQYISPIIISDGVKNRIEGKYGKKTPIGYNLVIADILDQSAVGQSGKNLKSLTESMKRMVNMGTRSLIFGLSLSAEAGGDARTQIFDAELRKVLAAVATDEKTGWLRRMKKDVADITPTELDDAGKYIESVFNGENAKLESLKEALVKFKDNRKLNEKEKEYVDSLLTQVDVLSVELTTARDSCLEKINANLVATRVPSSGANVTTVVQVQEQEQQVQQQQQQVEQTKVGAGEPVEKWKCKLYTTKDENVKGFADFDRDLYVVQLAGWPKRIEELSNTIEYESGAVFYGGTMGNILIDANGHPKPHGTGVLTLPDGTKYDGEWTNGYFLKEVKGIHDDKSFSSTIVSSWKKLWSQVGLEITDNAIEIFRAKPDLQNKENFFQCFVHGDRLIIADASESTDDLKSSSNIEVGCFINGDYVRTKNRRSEALSKGVKEKIAMTKLLLGIIPSDEEKETIKRLLTEEVVPEGGRPQTRRIFSLRRHCEYFVDSKYRQFIKGLMEEMIREGEVGSNKHKESIIQDCEDVLRAITPVKTLI